MKKLKDKYLEIEKQQMSRQKSVSPSDPGFRIKDNGSWPKKKRDLSNERLLQFNPD